MTAANSLGLGYSPQEKASSHAKTLSVQSQPNLMARRVPVPNVCLREEVAAGTWHGRYCRWQEGPLTPFWADLCWETTDANIRPDPRAPLPQPSPRNPAGAWLWQSRNGLGQGYNKINPILRIPGHMSRSRMPQTRGQAVWCVQRCPINYWCMQMTDWQDDPQIVCGRKGTDRHTRIDNYVVHITGNFYRAVDENRLFDADMFQNIAYDPSDPGLTDHSRSAGGSGGGGRSHASLRDISVEGEKSRGETTISADELAAATSAIVSSPVAVRH